MNFRNISIRSRSFLLVTGSVLFWLLAGFLIFSLINNLTSYQDTSLRVQSISQKVLQLQNAIQFFYVNDLPSEQFQQGGRSTGIDQYNEVYHDTHELLGDLKQDPTIINNPPIVQKLDRLSEYLTTSDNYFETMVNKSRQRGWDRYGLSGTILEQISKLNNPSPAGILQEIPEILRELELYLVFPRMSRLISIENKVLSLENTIALLPANDIRQDADMLALQRLLGSIHSLLLLDHELGITRYEGLQSRINRTIYVLYNEAETLEELYGLTRVSKVKKINFGIAIIILLSAILLGTVLILFSRSLSNKLQSLKMSVRELVTGKTPEVPLIKGKNELSEISLLLKKFSKNLMDKTRFATALAEGRDGEGLEALSQEDSLANALIRMEKQISIAKAEDLKHQQSSGQRRWANEGIAKFGEILRIYNNEINILAEHVIQELVSYLDASAGGFFLVYEGDNEVGIKLIASFAFERKKYIQKQFAFGEGLIGTCAIEQDKIFLTKIPDNYLNITSGLGESKPRSLLIIPLKLENETLGVIEIASINVLKEHEIIFVEKLAESIASAVATVKMNMRTAQLLEQSQKQAREMASQEEIMRQHMEELKITQEKSARRESEISGILNAIHNSSLVAEYNIEEELISINDKFQVLLESQTAQLLGKKYHEIIGISRHTDAHKKFWEGIRDGKTISRIDKITTVAGQEIWLRQTYTPILDKDGEPFKVLNIANDITETIKQQESLEKQANEITRKNIEMGSFNDAVDLALIKCVYSPGGLILEVNENFENATGFTGKEMIGKNNRTFLQRAEKEQFDKIWDEMLKDKPYSGVIRRTKPTGEEVWIMSTFTPVKDENGNIYKIYLLGQDITERKLKYQLLEEANNEIDRLNRQLKNKDNK
jgi:methyl-accepting chemotaxis protein